MLTILCRLSVSNPPTLPTNDWSFGDEKPCPYCDNCAIDNCYIEVVRHVNVYRQTEVILTSNEKGLITRPAVAVTLHVTLVLMYVVIS